MKIYLIDNHAILFPHPQKKISDQIYFELKIKLMILNFKTFQNIYIYLYI